MATGDQQDMLRRLQGMLPPWFGDVSNNPVLTGILTGLARALAFIYSSLLYVQLQMRIMTATDDNLDIVAADFFGNALVRRAGQSDVAFRSVILANLFREKGTRHGLISALQQLTGRVPVIFEPTRVQDAGAYGSPLLGYGSAGGYGSLLLPDQVLVTAFRPSTGGVPNVAPYASIVVPNVAEVAGYGQGPVEYASASMIAGAVMDADIISAVESVRPVGVTVWLRISN